MDIVQLSEHSLKNVFANQQDYARETSVWSGKVFKKKLSVEIVTIDNLNMEFDLIGICAPFVNAIRRILIAEVPTMAIEKVHVYNNTSIIQDEVLAHRLGLIPLKADPRKFVYRKLDDDESPTADDTLEFHLKVNCKANQKSTSTKLNEESKAVLTKEIQWIPIGDQLTKFKSEEVGPVSDDILIAKLKSGHELDLKLVAVKGIGKDHAKFQPVATASYRLLPQITLTKPVEDEKAQRLKSSFSPGVIELYKKEGKLQARIANARYDSCSRNVYRYEDLKDCVKLSRVPEHYIFTVESVGALPPNILFLEAIGVLRNKCERIIHELEVRGRTSFL